MIRDLQLEKFNTRFSLGKLSEPEINAEAFEEYRASKSDNTLRRQASDLALFANYLKDKNGARDAGNLAIEPGAWTGVGWQAAVGFQRWQVAYGYAIASINVRLSTIKIYSRLATMAGILDVGENALIAGIKGYSQAKGKEIDEARDFHLGEGTRIGAKKSKPVSLNAEQARNLKEWTDTPRGRRDTLLMCLLLDHGLRAGEIKNLRVENFDLATASFGVHRTQLESDQTMRMTQDTLAAATAYLTDDAPERGALLRGSRKSGELTGTMGNRAIAQRVRALGKKIGVEGLSPSDCRRHWAVQAAKNGASIEELREAGGWASLATAARYVEQAKDREAG